MDTSTSETADHSLIPIALPATEPADVRKDTSGSSRIGHRLCRNQSWGSADMEDGSRSTDRTSSGKPRGSMSPTPNIPRARTGGGGMPEKSLLRSNSSGGDEHSLGGIRKEKLETIFLKLLEDAPYTLPTSSSVGPPASSNGGKEDGSGRRLGRLSAMFHRMVSKKGSASLEGVPITEELLKSDQGGAPPASSPEVPDDVAQRHRKVAEILDRLESGHTEKPRRKKVGSGGSSVWEAGAVGPPTASGASIKRPSRQLSWPDPENKAEVPEEKLNSLKFSKREREALKAGSQPPADPRVAPEEGPSGIARMPHTRSESQPAVSFDRQNTICLSAQQAAVNSFSLNQGPVTVTVRPPKALKQPDSLDENEPLLPALWDGDSAPRTGEMDHAAFLLDATMAAISQSGRDSGTAHLPPTASALIRHQSHIMQPQAQVARRDLHQRIQLAPEDFGD